jgi:hypothetical protein
MLVVQADGRKLTACFLKRGNPRKKKFLVELYSDVMKKGMFLCLSLKFFHIVFKNSVLTS